MHCVWIWPLLGGGRCPCVQYEYQFSISSLIWLGCPVPVRGVPVHTVLRLAPLYKILLTRRPAILIKAEIGAKIYISIIRLEKKYCDKLRSRAEFYPWFKI